MVDLLETETGCLLPKSQSSASDELLFPQASFLGSKNNKNAESLLGMDILKYLYQIFLTPNSCWLGHAEMSLVSPCHAVNVYLFSL